MIETAIRTILLASTDISAIIDDRIRPTKAAQDDPQDRPCITYHITQSERERYLNCPAKYIRETIQLSVWSPSHETVESLANLLIDTLDDYRGTVGNFVIDLIEFDTQDSLGEAEIEGRESPMYQMDLHFKAVFHRS